MAGSSIKLNIALNENWKSVSGDSELTKTLMRRGRANNNALQISWISWESEDGAPIDPQFLLPRWIARLGATIDEFSFDHSDGRRATARFEADGFAYGQAWCVVDGDNLINVTFICDELPSADELREVEQMVESLGVVEGPPARPRKWMWF